MVRDLLIRGMLAGLIAGLLAFGFAKVFGEPQVDRAIAFEEQNAGAEAAAHQHEETAALEHEHGEGAELVSREVQSTLGLFTGVVVYGTAFGGLFALAFAFLYGRVGGIEPRQLAALLAAAGFVAIVLVPALKYAPNPPAVGDPGTIGYRTGLFFLMLLISLGALTFAVEIGRRLLARHGGWNATLIAGGAFIGIIAVAQLLLPDINEVPGEFPATVLWKFRMASFGMQALMWTTLGLVFGLLAERSLGGRHAVGKLHSA
jgi:predicted cobalt transporter CbtA